MVRIPKPAVIPIMIICDTVNSDLTSDASNSTKVEAPNIVGIAIRKENRVASIRLMPKNRAAVMQTPERLAPGMNARHWQIPIKMPLL